MGKSNLGKKEPPVISSGRSKDGKEQGETENIRVSEHSKQLSLMAGAHSVSEAPVFPVDGQLLMVLPRAGASVKNPDVQLPILRSRMAII